MLHIVVRQNEHVYLACAGEELFSLFFCNTAVRIVNDKVLVGGGTFPTILSQKLVAGWPHFFKRRKPFSQGGFDPDLSDIAYHSPLHISQGIWMFAL